MMATQWRGCDAGALQAGGHRGAGVGELAVAERLLGVAVQAGQVVAPAMGSQMPLERVEQGLGVGGGIAVRNGVAAADRHRRGWASGRLGTALGMLRRGQQIGHGFGALQRVVGQANGKSMLDAQQQLGPGQAVEAEVAVERAGQCHARQPGRIGVQLAQRVVDQRLQGPCVHNTSRRGLHRSVMVVR